MVRTDLISIKCMLNVLRHYDEKSSKVSFGQVLFAILLMVKSCV